jgi:hypothetical protein
MNAGWVLLLLIVAAVAGYGLKRLADRVLLTKGDSCRLEGDQ